ncbi:MAG: hypothetical protein ABJA34_08445 [Pseudonocardiales bacterium]
MPVVDPTRPARPWRLLDIGWPVAAVTLISAALLGALFGVTLRVGMDLARGSSSDAGNSRSRLPAPVVSQPVAKVAAGASTGPGSASAEPATRKPTGVSSGAPAAASASPKPGSSVAPGRSAAPSPVPSTSPAPSPSAGPSPSVSPPATE